MSATPLPMPVTINWVATSTSQTAQSTAADPLVLQTAQLFLGLKGDQGDPGEMHPDIPSLVLAAQTAATTASQMREEAEGQRELSEAASVNAAAYAEETQSAVIVMATSLISTQTLMAQLIANQ